MGLKKIRLVWGTPSLAGGDWRLGLFNIPEPLAPPAGSPRRALPDYWRNYLHRTLHVSMRGVCCWSAGLAVGAYLAGAAVVLHRLKENNPHNRIGYLDLALPSRWPELDRLRAEGWAEQGRAALEAGGFMDGFGLLRMALDRNPADASVRLEVARLYAALRLLPQARTVLRAGLEQGYPGRESLAFAFGLAAGAEDMEEWARLCDQARTSLLALEPRARPNGDERWLDQQNVKALIAADRGDETPALVEARYAEGDPFRREITILRLLETGRATDARSLAGQWAEASPRAPEPWRLLVRACREAGDHAGMDGALVRLRALDPAKPEALLYAVAQQQLAGRADAAMAAMNELFFRHGADRGMYEALGAILVELKNAELTDRMEAELRERGLPPRPALWTRLQIASIAHDWTTVRRLAESLRGPNGPSFTPAQTAWLATMRRLAEACLDAGSGTQASLVDAVAEKPGTLKLYRFILDSLLEAGRIETARRILNLAEGPYPEARPLEAFKIRIEAARQNALATLPPSPTPAAAATFASCEALAAAVDERSGQRDESGALALIASVRRAQPAWALDAGPRLDRMELPLLARADDPLRLQLLVRTVLSRDASSPEALLTLAREVRAAGHRANAVLLVKEIIRHDATSAEAITQLAEWEPARIGEAPLDTP